MADLWAGLWGDTATDDSLWGNLWGSEPPTWTFNGPVFAASTSPTSGYLSPDFSISKAGTIYWVAVPDGDTAPTVQNVIDGEAFGGGPAVSAGNGASPTTVTITGLLAATDYDIYAAAEDTIGARPILAGLYNLTTDAAPDVDPVVFNSASVTANGLNLAIVLSETVTVNDNSGFTIAGKTLVYVNQGPDGTLNYTVSPTVYNGDVLSLGYTTVADGIEDLAGNDLDTFSGKSIVNGSTQTVGMAVVDHFLHGFGFDTSGYLIISAAGAIDHYLHGLPFTADGSLCVEVNAVVGWSNGWPLTTNGRVAIA